MRSAMLFFLLPGGAWMRLGGRCRRCAGLAALEAKTIRSHDGLRSADATLYRRLPDACDRRSGDAASGSGTRRFSHFRRQRGGGCVCACWASFVARAREESLVAGSSAGPDTVATTGGADSGISVGLVRRAPPHGKLRTSTSIGRRIRLGVGARRLIAVDLFFRDR